MEPPSPDVSLGSAGGRTRAVAIAGTPASGKNDPLGSRKCRRALGKSGVGGPWRACRREVTAPAGQENRRKISPPEEQEAAQEPQDVGQADERRNDRWKRSGDRNKRKQTKPSWNG